MPWNDEIFRDAIDKAASRRGKTTTAALKEAGLSTGTMTHPPENGRRLDIFERLMPVLDWSPRDVLELIARAFDWDVHIPAHKGGEVHIILRNVEVLVTATSGPAGGETTQSGSR